MRIDPEIRFWSGVEVRGPNQCWLWRRSTNSEGYGQFSFNGRPVRAHRMAFELFYGEKPKKFVLHKCDNPTCVNPHHLYEGDSVANGRDCMERGNTAAAKAREQDPSWKRGRIYPWNRGKKKRRVSIRTKIRLARETKNAE